MAQPSADEFLGKACAGCGDECTRVHYSKKQWNARAVRRCLKCVENGVEAKICEHGRGAYDCPACIEAAEAEADEAQARFCYEKVASAVRFTCARVYFGTDLRHDVEVTFYVDSVRMKWNEGCADDPVQITFPADNVCDFGMYHGPTGPVDEEQLAGRRILAFRKPYRHATPERKHVHFSGEVVRCDNGAVRVACDNGTVLVDELTNMNWMLEDDTLVPNHFFAFKLVDDQWVAGFQPVPGISPEAQALDRVPGFDPGAAAGPRRYVAAILAGKEDIETFKHAAVSLLQGICHYPAAKSCWGNLRPRLIETSAEAIRYLEGAMLVEQGNVREAGRVLPAKNIRKVISEVISRLDTVTEEVKFRELVRELEAKADAGQIACLSNGLMEHAPTIVGRDLWCDCVDKVRTENRPTPPVFCPSNATETTAAAAEVEKYPSRSGLEKSDLFQAIHKAVIASADTPSLRLADSPVFLEFTKAVAAHTQYALNADRGNLMQRLAHDILVHTPEQQMLDTIKAAGWVPSEERALFLKQYRFILELRANSEQETKSKQEMDKVKKIMAQYLASENRETKNSWVKKLVEDAGRAYERHRRQNQRVERRKCDVCERQDLTSAPRFMMCAGCGKRRYCSGICQEKDWRENGHKMTCAPISDFACRVTGGCPVSERGYCDFCAETFCLDCEDDLRRCDDCGLYSCGSQEAHKFGPIDRICPRIWGCEACGKYYCPRCQVVETCVICDMDFCDFCGSNCSICNDPICDKCCDAREAKGLANLCAQCGDASGWELVDDRWVKRPRADDAAHDALAERLAALEAKP